MKSYLALILLLFFYVSCEKEAGIPTLDGDYVGSYTRGDSVSAINISIADYSFQGGSSASQFPLIGWGTVGWNEYAIEFTDESDLGAVTDLSLVLNGKYTYTYIGSKLTFWRGTGEFYERYTIEKLKKE